MCGADALERLGTFPVGTIPVPDKGWSWRPPVGSAARVLPSHARLEGFVHASECGRPPRR